MNKFYSSLLFYFIFSTIFSQIRCFQLELSVSVEPGTRECFHQVFTPGLNVYFNYQVISGGDFDISFWLTSPSNRVLISELNKNMGQHQILSDEKGEYRLCFDNTFSHFAVKQVFFYIYTLERFVDPEFPLVQSEYAGQDVVDSLDVEVSSLNNTFLKLKQLLDTAERFQSMWKVTENIDRYVMEANFTRVNNWSVINIVVLLIVSAIQVFMIRSLFEEKSKIGKILRSGKLD
jgi:protein ERP2